MVQQVFTQQRSFSSFPAEAKIDVFDRLPSPFGLVRSGVAPDHQETKIVTNQFTKVLSIPRLAFFGNVCVGKDIDLIELRKLYDVVVLAYGSESDISLGIIPAEDLYGVFSAREFYGGIILAHPDSMLIFVPLILPSSLDKAMWPLMLREYFFGE